MIVHATNLNQLSILVLNDSSHVFADFVADGLNEQGLAVLGAKYDVIIKACVGAYAHSSKKVLTIPIRDCA